MGRCHGLPVGGCTLGSDRSSAGRLWGRQRRRHLRDQCSLVFDPLIDRDRLSRRLFTRCVTTCLVDNGEATGWAEASSHDAELVDVEAIARRSAHKADTGRGAIDAEPGTYEVVLEPSAVAMLLDFLSYTGMGAKSVIEGESFLSTRTGKQVAAESITVADDVHDGLSVGLGFDLEGVPKKRVAVIDGGTATGPVTDLRTARKLGVEPDGTWVGVGRVRSLRSERHACRR